MDTLNVALILGSNREQNSALENGFKLLAHDSPSFSTKVRLTTLKSSLQITSTQSHSIVVSNEDQSQHQVPTFVLSEIADSNSAQSCKFSLSLTSLIDGYKKIFSLKGFKKLLVLVSDSPFERKLAEKFSASFSKRLSIETKLATATLPGLSGYDAVVVLLNPTDLARLIKDRLPVPVIGSPNFEELVNFTPLDGALFPAPQIDDRFVSSYLTAFGNTHSILKGAIAYELGRLLLAYSGDPVRDSIFEYLSLHQIEGGPLGPLHFKHTEGNFLEMQLAIKSLQNGSSVVQGTLL